MKFLLFQEESEKILGQKWYEKIMFLWKTFKKLRWKQKIVIHSFENFHLFISNICRVFLTSLFKACVLPNIKIFLVYQQKFFEVFDFSTTNLLNIVF